LTVEGEEEGHQRLKRRENEEERNGKEKAQRRLENQVAVVGDTPRIDASAKPDGWRSRNNRLSHHGNE
jgi:hypothetical protein